MVRLKIRLLYYQLFPVGFTVRLKSGVSRMVAGIYILAIFLAIATFTGNLTATLAVKRIRIPFETIEEMTAQGEYELLVRGSSASSLFIKVGQLLKHQRPCYTNRSRSITQTSTLLL